MSYQPTNWVTGDRITSEKLNKIEQGIVDTGGILFITEQKTNQNFILSHTWQQIYDALAEKKIVVWVCTEPYQHYYNNYIEQVIVDQVFHDRYGGDPSYIVNAKETYYALTPNDYPEKDNLS